MLDISANLLFLKTNRRHRIPSCPEAFPIKVSLSSPKLARNGNGTLALDRANHLGHRILRRNPDEHVDMVLHHMPFHDGTASLPANSRNTGPRKLRILPYSAFFRPFGIKTT